jgi:hypothetical protein
MNDTSAVIIALRVLVDEVTLSTHIMIETRNQPIFLL